MTWPSSEWRKSKTSKSTGQVRHRRKARKVRSTRRRATSKRRYTKSRPRYSRITTGSIARPNLMRQRAATPGKECVSLVSVVGDQATSIKGAQAQAKRPGQQQVRFRNGELYSDARNANKITFRCVDSSIRNFANRATEAIGINSQLKRCSMTARPCRAPSELDNPTTVPQGTRVAIAKRQRQVMALPFCRVARCGAIVSRATRSRRLLLLPWISDMLEGHAPENFEICRAFCRDEVGDRGAGNSATLAYVSTSQNHHVALPINCPLRTWQTVRLMAMGLLMGPFVCLAGIMTLLLAFSIGVSIGSIVLSVLDLFTDGICADRFRTCADVGPFGRSATAEVLRANGSRPARASGR